jgi:hypothetical protein
VNKLRTTGLLIDKKENRKSRVLTEENSDDIGARIEHRPRKSPKRLAQETHGVHFCSWFLQSVVEGELNLQLTFFCDEAWFYLQGYVNTRNNHYWSSQNPHLTHEIQLHPVKVGASCAVSARRIVVPVFFNETINSE